MGVPARPRERSADLPYLPVAPDRACPVAARAEESPLTTRDDSLWPLLAARVPAPLLARLVEWLESGRTGRIVFHIADGAVRAYELVEAGKVDGKPLPIVESRRTSPKL